MNPTIKRYCSLKFNKSELNTITSYLGITAAICAVLVANNVGTDKLRKAFTVIGGISGSIVSLLINKPADSEPSTYTLEHQNIDNNIS